VGSVLIRMDSTGQILWRKFFADQNPIGWAQGEDGNLGVLTWESELAVETLDLDGNRLWRCAWSIDGERLKLRGARLAAAKGGGFVVLMGRQLPTDLTASLSQSSEMLELFKVNGDGTPEWRSTIGGLLDEFGFGLEVMGDGGLLVGGSSQSITDSTDGWLLRLDSCGQAGPNCVAEFEHREAGFSFAITSIGVGAPLEDYALPAAFETQGVLSSLGASAFQTLRTDMLVTRQCSAVSKDDPVLPAATYVDLNIIIQSGEGIVDQVGGDGQGFPCTSSCSYSFPVGTTVQLLATPLAGFLDPSWTGGDCGPGNSASCSITMDGSRTVFLDFPPEGTYQGLLDLNVIIQGPGSGQVLISPPNFSISDSFLFEDLSAEGDSHVITATPDAGSTFAGFTGCDSVDGFEGFLTFGTTDRTVTVTFQ
ncbi:MAG: hypothetical protein P1V35_17670, partial [Planctomycetota bacterium]|nr:hypothetical protein [Planctomycetota bacterium]